jgi:hypothetical protein
VTWSALGPAISEWEHIQVLKNTNDRLKSVPAPTGGTGNASMFTVLDQDQFAVGDKCQTIGGAGALRALDRMSNRPTRSSAMSGTRGLRTGSL